MVSGGRGGCRGRQAVARRLDKGGGRGGSGGWGGRQGWEGRGGGVGGGGRGRWLGAGPATAASGRGKNRFGGKQSFIQHLHI